MEGKIAYKPNWGDDTKVIFSFECYIFNMAFAPVRVPHAGVTEAKTVTEDDLFPICG